MEPEKKLKVLYIITKSNWGGAQRHVFDLATNLPKNIFETTVALGGDGVLKKKLEEAGVKTVSIKKLARNINTIKDTWSFFSIYRLIKAERPDVLHLHSPKAGGLGVLAGKMLGIKKIIFTAHGWTFKEKRPFVQKKIIEYLSWLTMALSQRTIVVSLEDKESIQRFMWVRKKVSLIYNGIDAINFIEKSEARKIILDDPNFTGDDTYWMGALSELHKNKGLAYAIDAFHSFLKNNAGLGTRWKHFIFIIIGEGEEKENLERLIAEHGLRKSVFLAGHKENAAVLLKALDAFVLPSLKEGLPYTLLEAGLAARPVIATNVGGAPEVIDDMKSGIIVRSKRPREIEQAMAFFVSHPEKALGFGDKLKERVSGHFTLQTMLAETINLYKKK